MLKTAHYLNISSFIYSNNYEQRIKDNFPSEYITLKHSKDMFAADKDSGYQGVALYNIKENHLVIASSGSSIQNFAKTKDYDFYQDLASDVEILSHKIPAQYNLAHTFYQNVASTLAGSSGTSITFTGHSLGAALSELLVAQALSEGKNANAVTFDGPGTKPIIEKIWSQDIAKIVHNNTTSHLGAANIINTANPQIGQIYQLKYTNNKWVDFCNKGSTALVEKVIGSFYPSVLKFGCSTALYPTHQMKSLQKEMNHTSGEFKKEVLAPNWNNEHTRSELINYFMTNKDLQQVFTPEDMEQIQSSLNNIRDFQHNPIEAFTSGMYLAYYLTGFVDDLASLVASASDFVSGVKHDIL